MIEIFITRPEWWDDIKFVDKNGCRYGKNLELISDHKIKKSEYIKLLKWEE